MEIKKMMVPVDNSVFSMNAVKYSIDFSKQMGSSILLLHCHHKFPSILGEPYLQDAINKIKDDAESVMALYRELYKKHNVEISELLLEEPAGQSISEASRIEKIDLIIMGSKGKSDLEGLILGSVTHKVLHYAKCPVMVVH